jgi:hypothetical protein
MRCAFRPSLNRLIARLMCWVLLFGWMAGAANACVLQAPLAVTAAHAAAHEHAVGEAGHHHHHHDSAAGGVHDHDGHDDEAPPGQQACKSLCDSEQSTVVKSDTDKTFSLDCATAATTGSCLIQPGVTVARAPRPDAGTLPAPPPIPIAFLRLTI